MNPDLGKRIRELRLSKGLSQRELAKRSNLTNTTISLLEHGRVDPSIASLKKVLDALQLSLSEFFAETENDSGRIFFRRDELIELASGLISYKQVGKSLRGKKIQILYETLKPGADSGEAMLSHPGEEGGVVIAGEMEVTVDGQTEILRPGDAYYFSSMLPHRFRNVGTKRCIVVSACSPPTF